MSKNVTIGNSAMKVDWSKKGPDTTVRSLSVGKRAQRPSPSGVKTSFTFFELDCYPPWSCWPAERLLTVSGPSLDVMIVTLYGNDGVLGAAASRKVKIGRYRARWIETNHKSKDRSTTFFASKLETGYKSQFKRHLSICFASIFETGYKTQFKLPYLRH